jgi:hypothetical protein
MYVSYFQNCWIFGFIEIFKIKSKTRFIYYKKRKSWIILLVTGIISLYHYRRARYSAKDIDFETKSFVEYDARGLDICWGI